MLRERVQRLSENLTQMQALAGQLSDMTLGELAEPNQDLPAPLLGQKFPAIFMVESEYRSALLKAEIDFVNDLVRRITEEGWGPVEVWRGMQAHCEHGYQRENERAVRDDADG